MRSAPVRQHWVPKVYLRAFRSNPPERNQLYVRDLRSKRTYLSSIDNVAVKKHLYTLRAQSAQPLFDIEIQLSELEAEVAPVLAQIRASEALPQEMNTLSVLAKFLATLHMRTRQGLQMIHGFRRDVLDGGHGFDSSLARDLRDFDGEDVRELFAKSAVFVGARIGERLLRMHWRLFRAEEEYFITSESPVFSYHGSEKRWGLGTPGVKTFCPISPSLLILITNEPFAPHFLDSNLPASAVREVNGLAIYGADQFIFSHRDFEPIQGLLHNRERRKGPEFGPILHA